MNVVAPKPPVVPFSLKDAPSLIERVWPAQKISVEAQKERKAGPGQTLPALGSYWKGRKPLVLVEACVLGALLPATDDPVADLEVFELLMGMSAEQTFDRLKTLPLPSAVEMGGTAEQRDALLDGAEYKPLPRKVLLREVADALSRCPYQFRMSYLYRPEEVDTSILIDSRIARANRHLGTKAKSLHELVEQLGIMRFGHRPKVADVFCGGGSIPFASARIGCDVFGSDLNPIAAMLTWADNEIIGGTEKKQREFEKLQESVVSEVDAEIARLGIEHDEKGNRAKTYLYCLEARCPQTGWLVPVSGTWLVSGKRNVVARLKPDRAHKRFDIDIVSNVSAAEAKKAAVGTVQGRDLVYELDGETYRTPLSLIRGDKKVTGGAAENGLRLWQKTDFYPRPDDVFQERLYCIHWMTKETLDKPRQETFFAKPTEADLLRDAKVREIVGKNLAEWQSSGLIPDMPIEPGENTSQPIRERGWTHWHHLYSPRHLLTLANLRKSCLKDARLFVAFAGTLDFMSKLTRWVNSGRDQGCSTLSTEAQMQQF